VCDFSYKGGSAERPDPGHGRGRRLGAGGQKVAPEDQSGEHRRVLGQERREPHPGVRNGGAGGDQVQAQQTIDLCFALVMDYTITTCKCKPKNQTPTSATRSIIYNLMHFSSVYIF
jgi:hypothetical protein